jgi:hypothetical protein
MTFGKEQREEIVANGTGAWVVPIALSIGVDVLNGVVKGLRETGQLRCIQRIEVTELNVIGLMPGVTDTKHSGFDVVGGKCANLNARLSMIGGVATVAADVEFSTCATRDGWRKDVKGAFNGTLARR